MDLLKQLPLRYKIGFYVLSMLVAFFAGQVRPAHAGTASMSWQQPTKNADGTAIAPILQTRLEYGSCTGATFGTKLGEWIATGSVTSSVSPNIAAGLYCIRAYTMTADGESAPTNPAQKMVTTPNPPTIPSPVSVAGSVFSLQITKDSIVMPQVGTVVAGKPCDPTQQYSFAGTAYMRIDVANVVPLGSINLSSSAAWGVCQ
jgi:hypothetical protein